MPCFVSFCFFRAQPDFTQSRLPSWSLQHSFYLSSITSFVFLGRVLGFELFKMFRQRSVRFVANQATRPLLLQGVCWRALCQLCGVCWHKVLNFVRFVVKFNNFVRFTIKFSDNVKRFIVEFCNKIMVKFSLPLGEQCLDKRGGGGRGALTSWNFQDLVLT